MISVQTSLQVHALRLTATAAEPLELDAQPGSSIRGALFNALLRRFCMNPAATMCCECPLNPSCPVAGLVAPLRDEHPRGRDVPRPFVLAARLPDHHAAALAGSGARLDPGQSFLTDLNLFGRAIAFLPYIVLSMPVLEGGGIGRPLQVNGGRRGRFRFESIDLIDPFGERTQRLYAKGTTQFAAPKLVVTPEMVTARAATLPSDRLTLHFLTPTRLTAEGKLVHRPDFRVLVVRLAERLDALECEYGDSHAVSDQPKHQIARDRYLRLAAQAERVRLVADNTQWVDVASYSARQGRATPIGGVVGSATFAGDITAELRELLVWGELIHVGKNAVKGDGLYHIQT